VAKEVTERVKANFEGVPHRLQAVYAAWSKPFVNEAIWEHPYSVESKNPLRLKPSAVSPQSVLWNL
jgi:hypothetical protein